MKLNLNTVNILAESFDKIGYLPANAKQYFSKMADDCFVFSKQLAVADSIHLHIKVADVDELPHTYSRRKGGEPQNAKEGYIKYAFADGYNFIFSSIPVSQEEKAGIASFQFPYLDHIGIDIRNESDEAYAIYNEIPRLAGFKEWKVVKQGGGGKKVYSCHVQVNEKYWVYPPDSIYWEFAFGNLIVSETVFGCDLRPANPALGLPEQNVPGCCGTDQKNTSNHDKFWRKIPEGQNMATSVVWNPGNEPLVIKIKVNDLAEVSKTINAGDRMSIETPVNNSNVNITYTGDRRLVILETVFSRRN